jgi:hypothetical protein
MKNGDPGHQLVPPGDDEGGIYLYPITDSDKMSLALFYLLDHP